VIPIETAPFFFVYPVYTGHIQKNGAISIVIPIETAPFFFVYPVYTGHIQKNGAVSKVNTFDTAPFFCVCPVYTDIYFIVSIYKSFEKNVRNSFILTEMRGWNGGL
jgi:hypothetical protein